MKRIAVLTSGGDAPGMNAAVRGVVRTADALGVHTLGVEFGYRGLIKDRMRELDARAVSGIIQLGGTILGTARSEEFRTPEGRALAAANLKARGVDGLVVIGGDGSFHGAQALSVEHGIAVVGIPGTIDNDLGGSDFTLGFDTAVNVALEAIDRIRDTASSHERLFFVEVMGRRAGWLALYAGLAGGASAVLVPERPTDIEAVRERVRGSFEMGKTFCIVVVAEGDDAGGAYGIANGVVEGTSLDSRVTVLGHVQRGGPPTMRDRVLGARLGHAAVKALLDGQDRIMVGERSGQIIRTALETAWTDNDHDAGPLLELIDLLAR